MLQVKIIHLADFNKRGVDPEAILSTDLAAFQKEACQKGWKICGTEIVPRHSFDHVMYVYYDDGRAP
jgi:hypothetical protein